MKKYKCDSRSHGNVLNGKEQYVCTVLYRLSNHWWAVQKRVTGRLGNENFNM